MDVNSASKTNITFALPATDMQVVMDNPSSGRAVDLSDLLKQTFIMTRDHKPSNIRSRKLSVVHILNAMASHLLLGNFAANGVTNAHNKENSIDPSAFLPQRNLGLIELER